MSLSGWIPSRFVWGLQGPTVQWTMLGEERLLDPFFEQTMQRKMMQPFHQLFRRDTPIEVLEAWVAEHPPAPLKGMIFHMSRCGSTLLAQMLAASERHIVASEPSPLDAVVRVHFRVPRLIPEVQTRWIQAMVGGLSQPRVGGEDAFFLKMDCWHVHQIDRLRTAFPGVPMIFLYRDPLEVMVSHGTIPAAWTVPGMLHPMNLGLRPEDWNPAELDVYRARALASICEGGLLLAKNHGAMLVNYTELPQAMFDRVGPLFGLSSDDFPAMREKARWDAKAPQQSFASDTQMKQEQGTERIREVVAKHLKPVYERLEALRLKQMAAETR
jgi:hypothetical protein